jgi:hypothetical protein
MFIRKFSHILVQKLAGELSWPMLSQVFSFNGNNLNQSQDSRPQVYHET